MKWHNLFDERQQKEIKFSYIYSEQFGHGTDGHNAKMIIAKMASLLDKLENALTDGDFDENIAENARKILGLE